MIASKTAALLVVFATVSTSCVSPLMISPLLEGRERAGPLRSSNPGLPDRFTEFVDVRKWLHESPELTGLATVVDGFLDQGYTLAVLGFVHVDVANGYLVGLDLGEWGGALWWIRDGYTTRSLLASENVRGIVADRASALAICGLMHLGSDKGQLIRLVKDGEWRRLDALPLQAAPRSFLLGADGEIEIAFRDGEVATYQGGVVR